MARNEKNKTQINPFLVLWQVIKHGTKKFWLVVIMAILTFVAWFLFATVEKHSVNIVTIITTIMAVLILLFDAYKSWESSLEKKLTVFFTETTETAEKSFRMCYIRASLAHEGDTRSLAQQLGSQLLQRIIKDEVEVCNQELSDCGLSVPRPPQLSFDAGGIDIFLQKSLLNKQHVIDSIVVINLEGLQNTIISFLEYDSRKKGNNKTEDQQRVLKEKVAGNILSKLDESYLYAQAPIISNSKIEPLPVSDELLNSSSIPKELIQYVTPYITVPAEPEN